MADPFLQRELDLVEVVKDQYQKEETDKRIEKQTGAVAPTSTTFADIRRKQRAEAEEDEGDPTTKRFRTINYTSEDSHLTESDRKLRTYYCSICGCLAVITDADIFDSLPTRNTDGAYALQENHYYHVKKMELGDRKLLKRPTGLELQFRYYCNDCKAPIAYRPAPPAESTKFSYFWKGTLVSVQSHSAALSSRVN
eukprot:Platyproteum_vivax@DN1088_c0_g1_i1.p1